VEGNLVVANREEFKEIFNTCVPILRSGGENQKIILMPIARYVAARCCSKRNHLVNFDETNYASTIERGLGNLRDWTKALSFTKRIRNFKVVCPNEILGLDLNDSNEESHADEFWDTDPVHLNHYGYETVADGILSTITDATFNRADTGALPKDTMPIERRQSWVMADEAVATRTDARGSWRGGRNRPQSRGRSWRGRGGKWRRPYKPY
jgi:hypothetical protein